MILPNKLSNKNKANARIGSPCSIHKYRRFTKKNKTFRTDLYFCADCGKSVEISKSFGIATRCWKCGKSFNMKATIPIFPKCGNCTNDRELISTNEQPSDLSFMEDQSETTQKELIENTLRELGLK